MGESTGLNAWVGYCDTHGKRWYTDRKRARHVAKQHTTHKNVYRCSVNPRLFHIGSLPDVVKHGYMTKDQVYGDGAA